MLLGDREASMGKRIADQPVRIEVDLPIMFVVAVREHGQHRTQRSSWMLAPKSRRGKDYAGTDFIVARNGRIASVYLFFDELP